MPNILCVDDHTLGLFSLIDALQRAGYTVVVAADAGTAIEMLFEKSIDAVLLRCHELNHDSKSLAAALRIVKPNVAIVMMSAFCSLPCDQLREADVCVHKAEIPGVVEALRAVLCASRFGMFRAVAA